MITDVDKDCFFFDVNSPHGGKQKRDAGDEPENPENAGEGDYDYSNAADDLLRYDKNNPQRGLRQITTGFRKWSLRYISDCPGEKKNRAHSVRANRLYQKILKEYNDFFTKFKNGER